MIWYGVLDLLLGPIFLYYFVFGLRNVDYGMFGFNSGKYTDGPYGNTGAGYGYGAGGVPGGAGGVPGRGAATATANANTGPVMANRV